MRATAAHSLIDNGSAGSVLLDCKGEVTVAQRPKGGRKRRTGLGASLTPRGRAVMRAFGKARQAAPGFVVACGVLPEVSEAASERLHTIIRQVAEQLNGQRPLGAIQRRLRESSSSAREIDRSERDLTALIGAETTAAYLFGLSVGLAIHALPDKLTHSGPQ